MTPTESKAVEAARREARAILDSKNCYPVVEGTHHASRVRLAEAVDFLCARVERLEEALRGLIDVQQFSTGWDNGVTDSTGTINEGAYWHSRAMDDACAALTPKAQP